MLRLRLDGLSDPLDGVTLPEGISALSESELKQALGHTLDRCGCADVWPVELNHACSRRVLALRVRGSVPPLELLRTTRSGIGSIGRRLIEARYARDSPEMRSG